MGLWIKGETQPDHRFVTDNYSLNQRPNTTSGNVRGCQCRGHDGHSRVKRCLVGHIVKLNRVCKCPICESGIGGISLQVRPYDHCPFPDHASIGNKVQDRGAGITQRPPCSNPQVVQGKVFHPVNDLFGQSIITQVMTPFRQFFCFFHRT